MLPILFSLSEESTYVNQRNKGKGLTIMSPLYFFFNSCASRMLLCTLQHVMSQAGVKPIFCSNHISRTSTAMLKTSGISNFGISTSLLVCTHILTFSRLSKLGNFISAFLFQHLVAIRILLCYSVRVCRCVTNLVSMSSSKRMKKQSHLSKSSAS